LDAESAQLFREIRRVALADAIEERGFSVFRRKFGARAIVE